MLFATGAPLFVSCFHAQSPSIFDHELSAGADATISALACVCSGVGGNTALEATVEPALSDAVAAASSLGIYVGESGVKVIRALRTVCTLLPFWPFAAS
jgi:hypothetical protein